MSAIPSILQTFPQINGVYTIPLTVYGDARGSFAEMFRQEWLPMVSWDALQMNRSVSRAGTLRGLHYHFHQVDYWLLLAGKIRVGLADLREGAPTHGRGATLDLDAATPTGLFIPQGVAHGFYAQTDVTLFYVVNQYYKGGQDEYGVAWDDPTLALDWGTDAPTLSKRDQTNPPFTDIPVDAIPHWRA